METERAADDDKEQILAGVSLKTLGSVNKSTPTPFPHWQGKALSPAEYEKAINIVNVCNDDQDIETLIALASSKYGLVNDEVRRKAWPILLNCWHESKHELDTSNSWRSLPRHKDEDQVQLDVNRSFVYYPKGESDDRLVERKEELSRLIIQVLREHPMLCYFQGYHDIVSVILLVLGVSQAPAPIAHLSLLRIRDFMLPSLSPSLDHLRLLPAILSTVDSKLCRHLSTTEPFFALSATLTLYAHDIQEYGDIARLFDFLIAQPMVVSIYFFAVIVLSRREELFDIPADEPEMLHSVLSKLPKPLDLETLIEQTNELFRQSPPESLPGLAWWKISRYSVLKTTRQPRSKRSLEHGEKMLALQLAQLRRTELRQQVLARMRLYRRPAGRLGLAISIGVLSYWMGRHGGLDLLKAMMPRRLWSWIVFSFP